MTKNKLIICLTIILVLSISTISCSSFNIGKLIKENGTEQSTDLPQTEEVTPTVVQEPPECPQDSVFQDGKCIQPEQANTPNSQLIDTSDIIVFKNEPQYGEILELVDGEWYVNNERFLKQFYSTYTDTYDFIAIFPTKKIRSNWSMPINLDVDGIGEDEKGTSPYTEKLKSLAVLDFYRIWEFLHGINNEPPTLDKTLLYRVLIHEIGHYWLAFEKVLGQGHWPNNLDLFGGDPQYLDIMGYYHWIIDGNKEICVDGQNSIPRFSQISLYLMGLIPPEGVNPVVVHEFQQKEGDDFYNTWGPTCDQEHSFTSARSVTIQEIIKVNGVRRPSYKDSQKSFRIAFVVLSESGSDIPPEFIEYIDKYKQALPEAWVAATLGTSTMHFDR